MDLPDPLYELIPGVYAFFGLTSMFQIDNSLGRMSGALLVSAALLILHMRSQHRRELADAARR